MNLRDAQNLAYISKFVFCAGMRTKYIAEQSRSLGPQ